MGQNDELSNENILNIKNSTKILFIDDLLDDFAMPIILEKDMGWKNIRGVTDIKSLEDPNVAWADVLFVDMNGVGAAIGGNDEGLGLIVGIKNRYKSKKVILYSARRPKIHDALNVIDYTIPKDATPLRFESAILSVIRSKK